MLEDGMKVAMRGHLTVQSDALDDLGLIASVQVVQGTKFVLILVHHVPQHPEVSFIDVFVCLGEGELLDLDVEVVTDLCYEVLDHFVVVVEGVFVVRVNDAHLDHVLLHGVNSG